MGGRSRVLDVLANSLARVPDWHPGHEHLLVAVSGGPDSTALLGGLARLAPQGGFQLTAAHVAHALRGAESTRDAAAAQALAERLAVTYVTASAPVASGGNLEARARALRYRALRLLARQLGATRIVTGHTRDDQLETVLLRLLRGAGRRGLGGIAPNRGALLRPLLGANRDDVRRFLAEAGLPWIVDRSNADLGYRRNRVRRLLVPLLEQEFNPRLGETVATMAAQWRDEDAYLADMAAAAAADWMEGTRLSTRVGSAPPAIARRVVRDWLAATTRAPSPHLTETVYALARRQTPGRVGVGQEACITSDGRHLQLTRSPQAASARPAFAQPLPRPGGRVLGPGGAWELIVECHTPDTPDARPGTHWTALLDADALDGPLVVRSPHAGDRLHIPGVGTRKLQDLLVDAKVPRADRWRVPVVAVGDTLLWVGGLARGSAARLLPTTRTILALRLVPLDESLRCR